MYIRCGKTFDCLGWMGSPTTRCCGRKDVGSVRCHIMALAQM
jgi:hypothetical protein